MLGEEEKEALTLQDRKARYIMNDIGRCAVQVMSRRDVGNGKKAGGFSVAASLLFQKRCKQRVGSTKARQVPLKRRLGVRARVRASVYHNTRLGSRTS